MKLILASKSLRRRQMFDSLGLEYEAVVTNADETYRGKIVPSRLVEVLSQRKAEAAKADYNDVVIASDTVVAFENRIFGKPADRHEAFEMIKALSGNIHRVYSGYAILYKEYKIVGSVCTKVKFRDLSDDEINAYVDTSEPYDKAGGYGIQENGGFFVVAINGDFNNVVGMPLSTIESVIREKIGISLLDFKKKS
ncbi:MAG: septum formation protein Maf [Clostridia bacterium]|nr:septum formation protein Maf [Clostridia bacterium]